jgi:hypothetical protein
MWSESGIKLYNNFIIVHRLNPSWPEIRGYKRERENNIKTCQSNIDLAQNTENYCQAYPKLKLSFKTEFVGFAPGKFKCSEKIFVHKNKMVEQSKYKASQWYPCDSNTIHR